MTARCNKRGQGEPHLGDSWCLCCTAAEAIVGELKCAWGNAGTRVVDLPQALRQPLKLRCVKAEEHSERSPLQYSEPKESEEKAHDVDLAPGLEPAPKARSVDRREDIPSRRRASHSQPGRRADSGRASPQGGDSDTKKRPGHTPTVKIQAEGSSSSRRRQEETQEEKGT